MDKVIESFINTCDEMMIADEGLISKAKNAIIDIKEKYRQKAITQYRKNIHAYVKSNMSITKELLDNCKDAKIKKEINTIINDLNSITQRADKDVSTKDCETLIKETSAISKRLSTYGNNSTYFDNTAMLHQMMHQQMIQQHLIDQQIIQQNNELINQINTQNQIQAQNQLNHQMHLQNNFNNFGF